MTMYSEEMKLYHAYREKPTKKNKKAWVKAHQARVEHYDQVVMRMMIQQAMKKRPKKRSLT